ncbi:MAG: hypothetical protein KDK25_09620 [Leptospiraceae bacterium]|nr:hypothetical protein [Leptospiraceae bacterium]
MRVRLLTLILFQAVAFLSCRTIADLPPYSPGSVRRPVELNGLDGQKQYLESLRTGRDEEGQVDFEFEKTIPGFDNHWLDVYLISPPEPASVVEEKLEEKPDRMRLYLDGYHPEKDSRTAPLPPGYFRAR